MFNVLPPPFRLFDLLKVFLELNFLEILFSDRRERES